MDFRIDPVGARMPPRPLRVNPIPSRREQPTDEREERREDREEGASYAPAPEPIADAYGPRAQGRRHLAPPATPVSGETTPTWVAALLRAR